MDILLHFIMPKVIWFSLMFITISIKESKNIFRIKKNKIVVHVGFFFKVTVETADELRKSKKLLRSFDEDEEDNSDTINWDGTLSTETAGIWSKYLIWFNDMGRLTSLITYNKRIKRQWWHFNSFSSFI